MTPAVMIEVLDFPARIIVGLKRNFIGASHPNSNAMQVIGPLWGEMSKQFFPLGLADSEYPLGVGAMWPAESGEPGEMTYFAGYEVVEAGKDLGGLEVLHIPASKYAAVTHTDSLETLSETVISFYSDLLPNSGHQRREGMDLELYIETGAPDFSSKAVIAAPII
jgi:predicted transcriptional regulator YdeE